MNDGGPAFPLAWSSETMTAKHDGLKLFDYYAATAMEGILASSDEAHGGYANPERLAQVAWDQAAAMLVERKKRVKGDA